MVITINGLSADSLRKAAKKVRAYQNRVADNNVAFVRDLAQKGIDVASHNLSADRKYELPYFSTQNPHVMNGKGKGDVSATLRLVGEQVAFIEFGAGITYNGNPGGSLHPKGVEFGYTIGSYGKHQGLNKTWYHYGEIYQGTWAAMPLYKASVAIKQNARELAMTRFRS